MISKSTLLRTMCLTLFLSSIILNELIGFLRSDYNLINHFISELGAAGVAYSRIINYVGFVPTAFSAFIFPCDYGCPAEGSFSQNMHNNLGLIYYLIIPVGLFVLGIGFRKESMIINSSISFGATFVFLLGIFMMLNPSQIDLLGLWQRLADYTVVVFLIFMSLFVKGESR